jgi:monovalent cation:H+ antiporter-2, CPA2 family
VHEDPLLRDIVFAVLAAFVGGLVAHRLRQPAILGYLLAGLAINTVAPQGVVESHALQVLAEIGVAFLMFAHGAEFSRGELHRLARLSGVAGILQILLTIAIGTLLAPMLGLSIEQGIFLGGILALSSAAVAMKMLIGRGELHTLHGQIAVGVLIIQDLAFVPLAIFLPTLVDDTDGLFANLGIPAGGAVGAAAVGVTVLVLLLVYSVGSRVMRWLLGQAALTQEPELLLLGVVGLGLGIALVIQSSGASLAFGAFLAGLMVSGFKQRDEVIAQALPLRDLFGSLFFVTIGMRVSPQLLGEQAGTIALLVAVVLVGRAGIIAVVTRLQGLPARAGLLAGITVAQIGEFPFVLASLGVESHDLPQSVFDLVIATAFVSILLTPLLMQTAPLALRWLGPLATTHGIPPPSAGPPPSGEHGAPQ